MMRPAVKNVSLKCSTSATRAGTSFAAAGGSAVSLPNPRFVARPTRDSMEPAVLLLSHHASAMPRSNKAAPRNVMYKTGPRSGASTTLAGMPIVTVQPLNGERL